MAKDPGSPALTGASGQCSSSKKKSISLDQYPQGPFVLRSLLMPDELHWP